MISHCYKDEKESYKSLEPLVMNQIKRNQNT